MALDGVTGLYHVRARTYDARTGRFTSRDSIAGRRSLPDSFNPYTFAYNNPLVFRDPHGTSSFGEFDVSIAIDRILEAIGLPNLRPSYSGITASRNISVQESSFLEDFFGSSIDVASIRIAGGGHPGNRPAWQPWDYLIQLDDSFFKDDNPSKSINPTVYNLGKLAHEALHIWQREHKVPVVSWDGLTLGITQGRAAYAYDTTEEDPNRVLQMFLAGNIEQQGKIFEDYVRERLSNNRYDPLKSRFEHVARYVIDPWIILD